MEETYFDWLCSKIKIKDEDISNYSMLLEALNRFSFEYDLYGDRNRAEDGANMRYRFYLETGNVIRDRSNNPCSILEMMIALAIRCESIMEKPETDDMTPYWFWDMIESLGLSGMANDNYDEFFIGQVICQFLTHSYEPNGKGGLFTIVKAKTDMRRIEIWYQMMTYLDEQLSAQNQ